MIRRRGHALYFIVLVLLFLLVKFHQQEVTAAEGGLMINFGNVDEAAPGADMALNDEIADARQQEQQTPKVESEEEQMTQDFEEAPAIKKRGEKEGRETQRREESHSATQAQSAAAGRKTARSEPQSAVPGPPRRAVPLRATVPGKGQAIRVTWRVRRTAVSTDRVPEPAGTGPAAAPRVRGAGEFVRPHAGIGHCRVPITGHATKDAWWSKFSSTVMVA